MTLTLQDVSDYARQAYGKNIVDQTNQAAVLYYRLAKTKTEVTGQNLTVQWPLFFQHNEGVGYRAEGGALPRPKNRRHRYTNIAMAYLYGRAQIRGQAIKATKNSSHAFASAIDNETRGLIENFKLEINRMSWGNGTGLLATIDEPQFAGPFPFVVTAGSDVTVNNTNLLAVGMSMDGFTDETAGAAVAGLDLANGNEITAMNPTANTIQFEADFTVAAPGTGTIFLFRYDSRLQAAMGIRGITDGPNSTGAFLTSTLQGIDGAANSFWRGNVLDNGGVLTPLALADIQDGFELGEIRSQGRTSIILTSYALRSSYLDLLVADRRFYRSLTLDGGFSALEYTGGGDPVPLVVDRMARDNEMYFLDERTLFYPYAAEPQFMDYGGSILRQDTDTDSWTITLYAYHQFAALKRSANTVMRDRI